MLTSNQAIASFQMNPTATDSPANHVI